MACRPFPNTVAQQPVALSSLRSISSWTRLARQGRAACTKGLSGFVRAGSRPWLTLDSVRFTPPLERRIPCRDHRRITPRRSSRKSWEPSSPPREPSAGSHVRMCLLCGTDTEFSGAQRERMATRRFG